MTLALPPDQLAGSAVSSFAARLRQNLRFDGLWWRKFAALGCRCGPEWVRRYLPIPTAAIIFLLVRLNRRGAIANMARIVGATRRTEAALAALRMYAEFARCMTETMEYYGRSPQPIQVDLPERDSVVDALREGRGVVIVTGHFGNWDIAAKALREHGRPINMVMAMRIRFGDRFSVPQETRALDRVMAEVVRAFEDTVRTFPTQWFQFAPFWPGGATEQRDNFAGRPAEIMEYR